MTAATKGARAGKILMTIGIGIFTFIPPVVDILTPTHIFHADWTPHARFHTMWGILSASSVGLLALWLLWFRPAGHHVAGVIGSCVLGAFMLAAVTMSFYGGALTDPDGVPLMANGVDVNLLTFSVAFVMLVIGWRLVARTQSPGQQ
jgi:hypothetical protein